MRLLFLAKRHPQQRDLLERPYGRFLHLPAGLAARGHEVHVSLLSHRGLPSAAREHSGVHWFTGDLRRPLEYRRAVLGHIRDTKPDWIVGASDLYFGILAARWARHCGARIAIDAYDNFESYLPAAWPLHQAWRRALRRAHLVTAAGPQLLDLLRLEAKNAHGAVVPMAADPGFMPRDRQTARRELGLPADVPLVGYCGSLFANRGAATLLDAWPQVLLRHPRAQLLVTGRSGLPLPASARHLGYLADETLPAFVASLDLACVTASPGSFGNFGYPAKLYEALACRVPVVASDIAPIRWILGGDERLLAAPLDAESLAARICAQLAAPVPGPAPSPWSASIDAFDAALRRAARQTP